MSITDIAARAMRPPTEPTIETIRQEMVKTVAMSLALPAHLLSPAKLTINHPSARIAFLPTTTTLATSPPQALQGSPRLALAIQHRFPLLLAPSVVEAIRSVYGTPEFPYEAVGTEFDRNGNDCKWSDVLSASPKVFDRIE